MEHFHESRPFDFYSLGRCPLCNRRYQPNEGSLLRDDGDSTMMYAQCGQCHGSVVFAVARRMGGVIGMVTDMTLNDVRRLRSVAPVTSDDVLGLHQYFGDVS